MIIIPLDDDKKSISKHFRKSNYFALFNENEVTIIANSHKSAKSEQFFEFFQTLSISKVYVRALGYKTFLKLHALGIKVFLIDKKISFRDYNKSIAKEITLNNAKELCTLGHKKDKDA